MKGVSLYLLFFIQFTPGAFRAQSGVVKTELAQSGTRDIKISTTIPSSSILELARPSYPLDVHVGGRAIVWVKIDRAGVVALARGTSGHPVLKRLAVEAARKSAFKRSSARRKHITGMITYVFTAAAIPYAELPALIGQQITVRGQFSLFGKVGPLVRIDGAPVYLQPRGGSFGWGRRYLRMEGKVVSVTGTLRFHKSPPMPKPTDRIAVAWLPDYFYFEAETASVELDDQ